MEARIVVFSIVLGAILALAYGMAKKHIILYRVVGNSMEPALGHDDIVLATRFPRRYMDDRQYARIRKGDVVAMSVLAFERGILLKRVVATAGDRLAFIDGMPHVNDAPFPYRKLPPAPDNDEIGSPPGSWHYSFLDPSIDIHTYRPSSTSWGPIIVPDHAVFVLGDHHEASGDSRAFGFVYQVEIVALVHIAFSLSGGIRFL